MKQLIILMTFLGFTLFGLGQTTIYSEDFTGQDGKGQIGSTNDISGVDWTIDVSAGAFSNNDDFFAVQSGIFEAQDVDGTCTWQSETFNITGYNTLEFSFDALADGDFEASGDIFKVECYIDGSSQILFEGVVDESIDGDPMFFDGTELISSLQSFTASISGTGSNAYIKVTANNNIGTELYGWDNLEVKGTTTVTRVQFVSSSSAQSEGSGTYNLTLEILEEDANNATDCEVALTNGSASDVDNYTTQSVTFPAGSSSNQTVMITITDDSYYEGDETLTFEIQNVSGGNDAASGHPSTFDLTIEDNDLPGLVITEIMPDPDAVGDSDGEWFEIYNTGSNTVDLDGFTISDAGSDSFTISNSLIISADSYLVFAENTSFNQNGGLIVDYKYPSGFTLGNSTDQLILEMPDNTEIDSVSYDSDWLVSAGKSMTLDPDSYSGDNNDPGNWYEAHTPYGDGDLGTPRKANDYSTLTSWNGSADSDWTNASNWDNGVPTSTTDVSIPADGGITIPFGKATANCNNLTIKSDASGTGSLILEGSLNVTGNSAVQRHIENDNSWHFLASPVSGHALQPEFAPEESGGTLPTDFDFYYFDETATDGYPWINLRASDDSQNGAFESEFDLGKGYLVAYSSVYSTKHTFSGTINSGSQTINLSYTSAGGTGWNLIGNPFTASIDWSVVDKSDLEDNYFYIYDNSANGGAGGYVYHNGSNGSGTTKFISPGQGFFVKVASNGSIGVSATELVHASQNYLKQEKESDDYIELSLSGETYFDETQIGINPEAKFSKDRSDAYKLFSMNSQSPGFYSLTSDSIQVAMNCIPGLYEDVTIPIGALFPEEGSYSISLVEKGEVFDDIRIELLDSEAKEKIDLKKIEKYNFNASQGSNENRFKLHMTISSNIGVEENSELAGVNVYTHDQNIYYNADENLSNASMKVYNAIGQVVLTTDVESGSEIIHMENRGAYIVKVQSNEGSMTEKVIIK